MTKDVTLRTEVRVRSLGVDVNVDAAGLLGVLTPADAPDMAWLSCADEHAQWAASGLMALTGHQNGPLLAPPRGMVSRVRWMQQVLAPYVPDIPDLLAVLGERAAISKLQRGGQISCGGGTRLLATSDGWVALCLARPEDVDLVPAWLAPFPGRTGYPEQVGDDLWAAISDTVSRVPSPMLIERGMLLGLAVSALGETPVGGAPASVTPMSDDVAKRTSDGLGEPLLVVDMSSLWAGPLCAHILQQSGASVVKVEGARRPDGARRGSSTFFDLLHAGQHSVSVDFASTEERSQLARLVCRADVIIEGSRPQALARHGITPKLVAQHGRARVWVSVTAHGRAALGERVGFGDDCAVAGALVATDANQPVFCGDAIADPLAGITAAAATLSALSMSQRVLVDVALSKVARAFGAPPDPRVTHEGMRTDVTAALMMPPRSRTPSGMAPALGAHNSMWLSG